MTTPLSGKKILITRSKVQSKTFSGKLMKAGAIPYVAPVVTFKPRFLQQNQQVFQQLHEYTWVFFTSANGVKFFFEQMRYWEIDPSALSDVKIAVIGTKTEKKLQSYGFIADFCPEVYQATKMVNEFLHTYPKNQRILLACGNLARKEIANELEKQQVFFRKVVIYDTLTNERAKRPLMNYLKHKTFDACTFTSPSTVQAFLDLGNEYTTEINRLKQECLCVCIGTTTKQKAQQAGFKNIRIPEVFTIDGMINEMQHYFNQEG